jgi:MYXO-CTERM domain-containing protein
MVHLGWSIFLSLAHATPLVVQRALPPAQDGEAAEIARAELSLTFEPVRAVPLATGERAVKLRQVHLGVPVARRGATVRWGPNGARLLAARVEQVLPEDVTPRVSSAAAVGTARRLTGLGVEEGRVSLLLWPTPDGVKLAWGTVSPAVVGFPRMVVIVDAMTGEPLQIYDATLSLNQANVFPSNPVRSPALAPVTLPNDSAGGLGLRNEGVESFNCIDQQTVRSVELYGVAFDLHMCDLVPTVIGDASGDYLLAPADGGDPEDGFAEISMFHHANRAYDLFLGWDPTLILNGGAPLTTVSNLRLPGGLFTGDLQSAADPEEPLSPLSNAFYSPADPLFSAIFAVSGAALWFGQGRSADFSYDGDVVYHEFTHAVVEATIQLSQIPHLDAYGTTYAPAAMNEALADYFSSALTGDPDVGEYAVTDLYSGATAIRSLTDGDTCPSAVAGESHAEATMFSGALWDARSTLPSDQEALFDRAVFQVMSTAPSGDLAYEDMAQLIVAEVQGLVDAAAGDALDAAFTARGLLPGCTRILEYGGEPLEGSERLFGAWLSPGRLNTGVSNQEDGWTPGVMQAHAPLLAGATKVGLSLVDVPVQTLPTGTPFTPMFLVRFGPDPITFTYGPTEANDDVIAVEANDRGGEYTATVPVPDGATEVHVMVVNSGDLAGAYTSLEITPKGVVVEEDTGTEGADEGGGCGCSTDTAPRGLASALAFGGLLARRRRGGRPRA